MHHPIGTIQNNTCAKALLAPFVEQATGELAGTRFEDMLSPECRAQFIGDFVILLATYAQKPLDFLVSQTLAKQNWLWGINAALAPNAKQMEARDVVAAQIEASEGAIVDEVAPLLRSILQRQTARFVTVTVELMERIWQDRFQIADELLGGTASGEIGPILHLDTRVGSYHDGGRTTAVVTCEEGRFVYKPRNCEIGLWFGCITQRYLAGALRQPRIIARHDESGDWGFEEFIERIPLTDKGGIARYWHNFGRAAALFQALGSEDLHCKNFVAAGDTPTIIDSEIVIAGEPAHVGDARTSPNLGLASKGFGHDIAGTLATSSLLPTLLGKNDDASPLIARGHACLPLWEGHEHDVRGYEEDFLAGFDQEWAELAMRATELADELHAATHMPVRRLIRSNNVYIRLLERLRQRDAYESTKRRELLEVLHQPLIRGIDATRSPLANYEIACLLEGDIPYFYTQTGSHTITGSDGSSDTRLLARSAQERALERIHALDEAHHSFSRAVLADNLFRALLPSDERVPSCVPMENPLRAGDALKEACEVLERLEQLVIASPSGESSWLFRSNGSTLIGSNVELGNGLGGVAAFLAALAPRTSDVRIRDLALKRLSNCLDRIEEAIACLEVAYVIPERTVPFGMADGLGGLLRTLDLIVCALDAASDHTLQRRAAKLRSRLLVVLPRADIEHAAHTDVYGGASGLLLALAESPATTGYETIAAVAERLVHRMLKLRGVGEGGCLWDTLGTAWPVSGFGHGQIGIAAALARATHVFDFNVEEAIRDALTFEFQAYNKSIGTWPDLREKPVSSTYLHGICSGAPGMGLASLMIIENASDAHTREQAQRILVLADAACTGLPTSTRDVLCCGNLSLVEYLFENEMRKRAGKLLAGVIKRKRELGYYAVNAARWQQTDDVSFLWGLSGIGYELLRYTDPSLSRVF